MKVLITGATNGMGKGAARALARSGQSHHFILLSRSRDLLEQTSSELKSLGDHQVSIVSCDLSKLSDARNAIQQIKETHPSLDALFINAGLGYAANRVVTEDGFDSHFQVNYLAQYLLVTELVELLRKSEMGGRVLFNVTEYGDIHWEDLQMESKWSYEKAIYQAMAAKRMLLAKLDRKERELAVRNVSFVGFRVHKTVWTNQINIIPAPMRLIARIAKFFGAFISMDECGDTMIPLFREDMQTSLARSGTMVTWRKNQFVEITAKSGMPAEDDLEKLWNVSRELLNK